MSQVFDSPILLDVPIDLTLDTNFFEQLGHRVMICHGPSHATLCPILGTHGCALAETAHGIIFALDLERPMHRAILKRYQEVLRDDIPIGVVVRPEQADKYADILRGLKVWTHPPGDGDLDGFASEMEAADLSVVTAEGTVGYPAPR